MASYLSRTRAMLQMTRYVPTLMARGQSTQTTPSAGQGIPPPGNFNSATRPTATGTNTTGASNTSGSKTPPFGDPGLNQSFMNTPMGKVGVLAALTIGIYAGYKMIGGSKDESKDKKDKKDGKDGKDQKKRGGGDQPADSAKDGKDQKDQKDQKKSGGGDQPGDSAKGGKDAKK